MVLPLERNPEVILAATNCTREFLRTARAIAGLSPAPLGYERHRQFEVSVQTFSALLCDLSRPESQDWWIRWGIETQRKRTERLPFDANLVSRWQALRGNPTRLHEEVMREIGLAG